MKFDITCIIPSSQTEGQLAAFAENVPANVGPPLHAHRSQIEIFHVIEGSFLFVCDGQETTLGPGGSIVIPAKAAHAFKNVGSETGRIHFELLAAGTSEEFFKRLVEEAASIEDIPSFFAQYDIDLLGPPLP
ncbi:Cupin domain protein [Verrucomicrobiia bacterium DG1235]|nr:Cupin domain protein [Verrucomicrobiae bacterium DG1235]